MPRDLLRPAVAPPPVAFAQPVPPPVAFAVPAPPPPAVDDPLADPNFAPTFDDFKLPTFDDFKQRDDKQMADAAAARAVRAEEVAAGRGEPVELTPQQLVQERVMELLTFDSIDERPADEEPYDYTARFIGRGLPNKAGVYLLPYLQSGHMLLLGVLLLCSIVSYPGFPLTELPEAYRNLLLQGIGITFVINIGCVACATPKPTQATAEHAVRQTRHIHVCMCLLVTCAAAPCTAVASPLPRRSRSTSGPPSACSLAAWRSASCRRRCRTRET